MKLLFTGSPRAGKTTFCQQIQQPVYNTDSLLPMEWSEHSQKVSELFDSTLPSWTVEGTAIPRALRKWLLRNHDDKTKKPCDMLVWLQNIEELTPGQLSMARGNLTILKDLLPELYKRKVRIVWEVPEDYITAVIDQDI